jgi:CRP-like cAMP-binding protein
LETFAGCGHFRPAEAGEVLIEPDQPQGNLFIIEAGRFAVERVVDGAPARVAELGPGDVVGEIAILQPPHASAKVIALEEGLLWTMPRGAFQSFLSAYPDPGKKFMLGLTRIFSERFLSRP